jgi:hypothetical protein
MVSFFKGRKGGSGGGSRLETEVAELETLAASASPGYETQYLNRAANLCVQAGQPARALGYYGRAIDAYLESGRFNAAEVLCRKVLEISPHAVRARCTLAWLALGKGFHSTTRTEVAEYVDAAERAGQQTFAAKQLRMMAEAAPNAELREEIARHLINLDAPDEADHVYGLIFQERNSGRPVTVADEAKVWSKVLRAALMGPTELRQTNREAEEDHDVLPSLLQKEPGAS